MRLKIKHDIHIHTHLSLCANETATIEYYVRSAKEKELTTVGIADHMWDPQIPFPESFRKAFHAGTTGNSVINYYTTQSIERQKQILKEIEQTDTLGVRFLFGGEVEYAPGRGVGITEKEAEKLDFIVVPNSHTHLVMDRAFYEPYQKHADYMLRAAMEICTGPIAPYVTSLAHPFSAVCCPYPADYAIDAITDEQFREVFMAAKENGIGVEINGGGFYGKEEEEIRNMGRFRVLRIAKDCGCVFTFGSDSHSTGQQDRLLGAQLVVDMLMLTENDIHPKFR